MRTLTPGAIPPALAHYDWRETAHLYTERFSAAMAADDEDAALEALSDALICETMADLVGEQAA